MDEEILTVKEAASFLKVQAGFIYQLRATHRIPYHYVGKQIRFFKSELIEWLKDNQSAN